MKLYAFVIMENHFHLIAGAEEFYLKEATGEPQGKKIGLAFFKAKHKTESSYQVWQGGYHPQEIQDQDMMRQKAEYIHQTPCVAAMSRGRNTGNIQAPKKFLQGNPV